MASTATTTAAPPSFLDLHRPQLESLGFPPALYARLEAKLAAETFDAGETFTVVEDEVQDRSVVCSAAAGVDPEADVWLIDHLYSFRVETYRQELKDRPELLARLATMMGLGEDEAAEEESEDEAAEDNEAAEEDATTVALASTSLQEKKSTAQAQEEEQDTAYNEALLPMRRPDPREKPSLYEKVCEQTWRYASSYRLVDPRDPFQFSTVWFVNDEFGSAFQNASPTQCNFRVSPFIYLPSAAGLHGAMAYSLAWPVARIEEGEECTRDYAFGCGEEGEEEGDALLLKRESRLATWFEMPSSVRAQFKLAHARKQQLLDMLTQQATTTTMSSSSSSSSSPSTLDTHFSHTLKQTHAVIKLYSDNNQVIRSLTRPEFAHVDSPAEADVVWVYHSPITATYRQEQGLGPEVVLSQTLGDECLVFKHLLPLTAARCQGYEAWLPLTYNMETETPAFIHEYLQRQQHHHHQEKGQPSPPPSLPSLFILKPWNLGHSMDSAVADSLPQALQLAQTCPKIASEYLHDIATVNGKKFDVRYHLMVRSWEPLDVFRWVHWGLRVSNHAYSLAPGDINDFEAHFTVLNYAGYVQTPVSEADFLEAFQRDNGGVPWSIIDVKVDKIIKDLFEAAAPLILEQAGREEARQLCSFYGVDVMVTKDLQPRLLECMFGPDCAAALKQDADFYNKAFGVLFLNEESEDFRRL